MKPFSFTEPERLEGVIEVLASGNGRVRAIAGGSDLLGELKEGIASYDQLVSLAGIDSLRSIEQTDAGLRIGALLTLYELEISPLLTGPYAFLAEAARGVATPEVRNQGTLGGNLCQRPRCLHYRSALVPCLKKGGDGCPASQSPYQAYLSVMGDAAGCYAVHPSDLAPPLIALGAHVDIIGPAGARIVPIETFFAGPAPDPTRETCLEPAEVVTFVTLPPLGPAWRAVYTKGRERTAGDFAVVSVAVGFEVIEGVIQSCRVVIGGAAPAPFRSLDAEAVLTGQAPSSTVAEQAAGAALASAKPLSHNAYKVDLAKALITRAVMRVASPVS